MYFLDSDIYIRSKNDYYRFSVCPAFWDFLSIEENKIRSIDKVYQELIIKPPNGEEEDELCKWAKRNKRFFDSTRAEKVNNQYASIMKWLSENKERFVPKSYREFTNKADPWLIATAKVMGGIVVTNEQEVGDDSKQIKIPNVCKEFNVRYTSVYDMLEKTGGRFVL